MEWPGVQIIWLVTSDPDGDSAEAARKARAVVERAVDQVREDCAGLPIEMRTLQERVRTATTTPLGARGMREIEDAFATWVEAIGAPRSPVQEASATLRDCDVLGDRVRAGYAVWWDYTPDGKRWWVQLVVDNKTAKRYWLDLGGTMWVTGLVHPIERWMPHDEQRGGRQIGWGGSSADSMYARPSTTSARRVGLTEYVYTTLEGVVYDVRPEVYLVRRGHGCSLPVPRLN